MSGICPHCGAPLIFAPTGEGLVLVCTACPAAPLLPPPKKAKERRR